ncbi:hypothetical protein LOD99_7800 [Oopsacas minuta]|uniref:Peptidylamidoglycolate lyase n=1 Tax=Oopsacas minuta TaxID=111878 RepID=A0AAV7JQB7_9METZ|nr:hypothetical protein LOD99_7800 [Oopsacas minuta]
MATNESNNTKYTHKSTEAKEWEMDYALKKQPVIAIGKIGWTTNEFNDASGLALSESNQLIYIADKDNGRIQVVTYEGNFVTSFGQGKLVHPWGIAVTEDYVSVTDYHLHTLIKFSDLKLRMIGTRGSEKGELAYPRGLCSDYNGDLYVADCGNNRVCIFTENLTFVNCLGTQQLCYPRDVKVIPNSIAVLNGGPICVKFYSRSGHLIYSCLDQDGIVLDPLFFCLDPIGNILMSDFYYDKIMILSPSGKLIHSIGRTGHGRGDFVEPCASESNETKSSSLDEWLKYPMSKPYDDAYYSYDGEPEFNVETDFVLT